MLKAPSAPASSAGIFEAPGKAPSIHDEPAQEAAARIRLAAADRTIEINANLLPRARHQKPSPYGGRKSRKVLSSR